LHEFHEERSEGEITFECDLRQTVGREIVDHFIARGYRIVALAVGKVHTHGLVELPESLTVVKAIVGDAKRRSSRAIRSTIHGSVWAAGFTFRMVSNRRHLRRANDYILYEQGPGAWTWSFRDASRSGCFGRKRKPR